MDNPETLATQNTQDVDNPETLATQDTQDVDNPETLVTLGTQDVDNPETLATQGTQDTGRRQTQHNTENLTDEQHGPNKNWGLTQVQDTICIEFIYGRKHRQVQEVHTNK